MNKDVIYIDVDDDVTAIIGKIKKSKEKIVAVVPPKRVGSLQSAVNLRLLDRMARADKKQLVLITNNQALIALAANASIPVAKNLQTKPEIADVPALAVDDGDDIIDGSELPIGDHAATAKTEDGPELKGRSAAMEDVDVEDDDNTPIIVSGAGSSVAKRVSAARSKVKIPNFDKFRKRLFLGIGGGVLLIVLLIWMFVIAPAATVVITAQTTPAPVSSTVKLSSTEATDFGKGVLKAISKQDKEEETVEFTATGEKDLGTKATGTVRFSTNSISNLGTVIPKGTELTTSGLVFKTDEAVTITIDNYSGADVGVTAAENGTNHNGATGSMSGAPSGISANLTGPTAGGTSNIVKAVSTSDIELAKGKLIGGSTDDKKAELVSQFKVGEKVIDSSFTVSRSKAVSSPAVNTEAPSDGKATLTIETTYTIYAVPEAELDIYLNASLNQQLLDPNTQKVYSTGIADAGLSDFDKEGKTTTIAISATGQIGPKIDEQAVKDQVKGKIYGEVQSSLESLDGIKEVDVKFSFFWVRTVPNDTSKIRIEFKLENE